MREREGFYYQVQRGDNLWSLSQKFGVSVDELRRANRLKNNNLPIMKLYVPRGTYNPKETAKAPPHPDKKKPVVQKPVSPPPKVITKQPANPPSQIVKTKPKATPQIKNTVVPAKKADSGLFAWPVENPVLAPQGKFGPRTDGTTSSGLQLLTKPKQPVLAAREGRVVYSGTMQGYGQTLILDHLDNFFTVYAQMESVKNLQNGFTVSKGSPIGYAGPTLHFEIRKLNQAVNPLNHMDVSRLKGS
ncbi:MAG: M23 family metallopeptidase [Candidatus Cloacimonetes bacterium]|nr:M23 family metallopeptidase [Candidatus Cloacimonadota bacterium]